MRNPRVDIKNKWVLTYYSGTETFWAYPITNDGFISSRKASRFAFVNREAGEDWREALQSLKDSKTGDPAPLAIAPFKEVIGTDLSGADTVRDLVVRVWKEGERQHKARS